jgi:hypothetical protein
MIGHVSAGPLRACVKVADYYDLSSASKYDCCGFNPLANPISSNPLNSVRGCLQMTVTIAAVTENMCMSRCCKVELVVYRIRVQTLARFTLCMPLKLIIHLYAQSVQISSAPCPVSKSYSYQTLH